MRRSVVKAYGGYGPFTVRRMLAVLRDWFYPDPSSAIELITWPTLRPIRQMILHCKRLRTVFFKWLVRVVHYFNY